MCVLLVLFPVLLESNPKTSSLFQRPEILPLCFFSGSFRVFDLKVQSLINFELVFVTCKKYWSSFILLHMDIHASFIKKTVPSPMCALSTFTEKQLTIDAWVYF
jgi:hypothetical protein